MTTQPPKKSDKSSSKSKKTVSQKKTTDPQIPARYQRNLNRLAIMREQAGKALYRRLKLAQTIYTDPEYHDKLARMRDIPIDALSPDILALAINATMPDLIAFEFNWTGTDGCISLQAILNRFPDKQTWINRTLPDLREELLDGLKPEKEPGTRRSATLKQLKERDEEIARLNRIIKRIEQEKKALQKKIDHLQQQVDELRHMLADTPSEVVA